MSPSRRPRRRSEGAGPRRRCRDARALHGHDGCPHGVEWRSWGAPLDSEARPLDRYRVGSDGRHAVSAAGAPARRNDGDAGASAEGLEGALVDRRGNRMSIPVRVEAPTEGKPLTAEVTLAPLAAGDYVVLVQQGEGRVTIPLRHRPLRPRRNSEAARRLAGYNRPAVRRSRGPSSRPRRDALPRPARSEEESAEWQSH